jgi:hypothetical protein
MEEMKNTEKTNDKKDVKVNKNFFVYLVIGLIIITFVISAGVIPGIINFVNEIVQHKEVNPDGTISIERMAQSRENNNPDSYIGKVLGHKIQFGHDDTFNRRYEYIMNIPNLGGYEKYREVRNIYEDEIQKVIGMYNAKKMDITVSNKSVLRLIAKNRYTGADGKIDYDKLRSEINKINLNDSEEIKNELLLENYEYDYFGHLPVSYSEVAFSYGINNTKVKVKYTDIPFNSISKEKLAEYIANNSVKYRQYKVGKIVFADTANAKRDAEKTLMELTTDPTQFDAIGEKLKKENKIINVINDSVFRFADDYDKEIADVLAATELGKVCNKLAAEPNVGYTIIKVLDTKNADVADDAVASRAKNNYVMENRSLAELDSQTKAKTIFDKVVAGEDMATVSSAEGIQMTSSDNEMLLTDNILPMLDFTDNKDMEFITKLFFSKVGTPVEPYKYANGVVVACVESRTEIDTEAMEADIEKLAKSSDAMKVAALRQDFYREEKKKHKVVDNFHYAIRIQDFFNMNQGQ